MTSERGFGFPKNNRFRRPEFREKLAQARGYRRQAVPRPKNFWQALLQKLGLFSLFRQIVFGIVVLLILFFLTISETFLVKEAVLVSEGGLKVAEINQALGQMSEKRIYFIPSNHILLLTQKRLEKALEQELPQIRKISSFRRIFPNKVAIAVEERRPSYVWQSKENFYLLDQEGVIFQKILNYEPTAYPEILITDETGQEVKMGEKLDIEKILDFIVAIKESWPQKISQTTYESFSVPGRKSIDLMAKTALGFLVYFDLERHALVQLDNLRLLLDKEIKPETYSGLSYIDLRLPNIAYYCYKDAPCALQSESRSSY